jgi:hypothetical protein
MRMVTSCRLNYHSTIRNMKFNEDKNLPAAIVYQSKQPEILIQVRQFNMRYGAVVWLALMNAALLFNPVVTGAFLLFGITGSSWIGYTSIYYRKKFVLVERLSMDPIDKTKMFVHRVDGTMDQINIREIIMDNEDVFSVLVPKQAFWKYVLWASNDIRNKNELKFVTASIEDDQDPIDHLLAKVERAPINAVYVIKDNHIIIEELRKLLEQMIIKIAK